jgi:two-component system chemotaxis response regulator CheB
MIRVLVVDDSSYARTVVSKRLAADPEIEVAGHATDGIEALAKIEELRPDVVTMDIVMPRMDGLKALEYLMKVNPTPVVMVSALTQEGADITIQALELGAVDFILKPMRGNIPAVHEVGEDLCGKVKAAARANLRRPSAPVRATALEPGRRPADRADRWRRRVVVIGASTGGPQALRTLLTSLPPGLGVPLLVVQHMPASFTASMAASLNKLGPLRVEEASEGSRIESGKVLVAPGGYHMTLGNGVVHLNDAPPECGVRPSVNVTMESAASAYGCATLGVVLTGMGADGTRGAGLIKDAGGEVIAEDESTCIVYGMPRSVVEAGFVDQTVPLPRIAAEIARRCRAPSALQGVTA